MNKPLLIVLVISLILLISPISALASLTQAGGDESLQEYGKSKKSPTDLAIGTSPENVSHTFNLHVVFVGYDKDVVNTTVIDANINQYYELPYWDACLKYTFKMDYAFASKSYLKSLRSFVLHHSVAGTGTTSAINVTALQYQRDTGTPMSIFLPQSGRAIDARAVEQWFADHPYGGVHDDALGYTFYVLNFTEFDSPDHSWEHWYNFSRCDMEAKSINDYWRLEWDNPLNPDVKFPYPAFTSKHRLAFIDPSAFQWYLTWARIWWGLEDYGLAGPKYAYYYQDLDGFLVSNDVTTPSGRDAFAQYLAGWIEDLSYNLVSPVAWPITGNTLSLQVLVLNDVSQYGYPNEKMKWILNSTIIEESVKQLAPYMKVDVSVRFENLSSQPEIEGMLNASYLEEVNGWRYYDGYGLFYNLLSVRDQQFNMKAADMTVDAYVFLLKNASFESGPGGMKFTGLGGLQQVLLLLSIDRYFRPDGVTPKSSLGMYMIHELGHNIAFPHTFSFFPPRFAGDFADDTMGYYSYSYEFCKMRTDMFRRTVVDMKFLELKKALRTDVALSWPWPRKTLFFRNDLLDAIESKIDLTMQKYDDMHYLGSYFSIAEAESLETYFRQIVTGIRVPGDIDSDGECHLSDFVLLKRAYGSRPSSPNWNPDADLNKDGFVNCADLYVLRCFFGHKTKATVGFFKWKTGAISSMIDVGEFIYPEWDMPNTDLNITYGLQNWGKKPQSCFMRISDITLPNLIESVTVKIYNQTTTVAEVAWTGGTAPPTDWVKVTLDPSARYSIMIEIQGTAEAYYEMTVISLECRQSPSSMHSCPEKPSFQTMTVDTD